MERVQNQGAMKLDLHNLQERCVTFHVWFAKRKTWFKDFRFPILVPVAGEGEKDNFLSINLKYGGVNREWKATKNNSRDPSHCVIFYCATHLRKRIFSMTCFVSARFFCDLVFSVLLFVNLLNMFNLELNAFCYLSHGVGLVRDVCHLNQFQICLQDFIAKVEKLFLADSLSFMKSRLNWRNLWMKVCWLRVKDTKYLIKYREVQSWPKICLMIWNQSWMRGELKPANCEMFHQGREIYLNILLSDFYL